MSVRKMKIDNQEQTFLTLFGQTILWRGAYHISKEDLQQRLFEDVCLKDIKAIKFTPPQYRVSAGKN